MYLGSAIKGNRNGDGWGVMIKWMDVTCHIPLKELPDQSPVPAHNTYLFK
jgi:hypothetical protein